MTIDLSVLPPRRRRPVLERFQRELAAELAAAMYPAFRESHGSENALEEVRAALVADGHSPEIVTVRLVRAAVREGR